MSRLFTDPRLSFYRLKKIRVATRGAGRDLRSRLAMQFNTASILPYVAFDKDAFPNRHRSAWPDQIIQLAETSSGFLA
jgi:hypothetical protein